MCARPWRGPRAQHDARDAAAPANGGTAEARPERARGGVHGDEEEAASLIGDGAGEERRRTGSATDRSGGGRGRSPAALPGGRGGRVRGEIGHGEGGKAAPTRNRRGDH